MKISGVEISNPDKVLFPKEKITKRQLVGYYEKMAEAMLPYLKNRPLTLHRFPDGVQEQGFYQKNASDYFPDFIKTVSVKTEEGANTQVYCNSKKSLIYLANQGTIGFHIWLSKIDKLHKPDKIVFDLDPPENSFKKVKKAARIIGDFFKEEGKDPQLMTTGQNGLHVWYTQRRTKNFDSVREEIKSLAQQMEKQHPDLLTTAVRKNKRDGKIFVDYLRNAYGQTSVCPYSVRPNKHAGIAKPISWEELEDLKAADQFRLLDFLE